MIFLRVITMRVKQNAYVISTDRDYVETRDSFPSYWVLF